MCLKTGDLLWLFHCTRVKERGLNVRIIVISLLSVVGKIYGGILVDRVCRVTGGLMMSKGALEWGGVV